MKMKVSGGMLDFPLSGLEDDLVCRLVVDVPLEELDRTLHGVQQEPDGQFVIGVTMLISVDPAVRRLHGTMELEGRSGR